ncbi:MAG: NADP-dependent malic enzyme [Ruminococcaceae bacterium]|nr:NADP-dependent malic enzyme [Oscillospiraceae bacterium]
MSEKTIGEKSLELHEKWRGKIKISSDVEVSDREALSLAYTPGVATPCLEIEKDLDRSWELTRRWNTVAVITDGSAVLGLGDIGPEAGMPVMEGKCLLFNKFGNIDAVPLCVRTKDVDEFVKTVSLLLGSFGGVNLEDISAPRCFEIERKLKEISDIPIFHDDQHGTAIIATAALKNALKLAGKDISEVKIVINGAGAAGTAIGRLFMAFGAKNLIFADRNGAISRDLPESFLTSEHARLAEESNPSCEKGTLAEVIRGADVFLGVSRPGLLTPEMIKTMADKPIIFAMANPTPEIMPDKAIEAGAFIVGTGRSDFPNQINNLLAFPGVFRGALDCRASDINEQMKIAAAEALASVIPESELSREYILPDVFDKRVVEKISEAVILAARESGVARK